MDYMIRNHHHHKTLYYNTAQFEYIKSWPNDHQHLYNYHQHYCRYSANGFVEELPKLPENRYGHSCAVLPSTGVRPFQTMLWHQAFIIAEGSTSLSDDTSSVLTLLSKASAWTSLAALPRPLFGTRASIVGGKMRLTGSLGGGYYRSEVIIWILPSMVEKMGLQ